MRDFVGRPPRTIKADGEILYLCGAPRRTPRGKWPMTSVMAGCHPDDISKEIEHDAKHGLRGTEYTRDGDVVWTGPDHRKRWLKSRNMYDRNAGYSDPTPD